MAVEIVNPLSKEFTNISPVNNPMRYIVNKNHDKIKRYLKCFNINISLDLDENCKQIAINKSRIKKKFDDLKKQSMNPKHFEAFEDSENYDEQIENYFDEEEKKNGFDGFEDESYEDFLPLVGLGAKVLKGGIKMIKNKLSKSKGAKEESLKEDNTIHPKIRNNVIEIGTKQWLTEKKQKDIDKIISYGNKEMDKALIRGQLVALGVSPTRFSSFEDVDGNPTKKAKDILSDVLGEYKKGEVAKGKNEAIPTIVILVIVAFILGILLKKFI